MKLVEVTINIDKSIIQVRCWLNVQGVEHPISFVLNELDLYRSAEARNATSWDNEDVISVAQRNLGLNIQLPA